jgi:CobQ/CobB/MinD/ParA nucleotide binding domain
VSRNTSAIPLVFEEVIYLAHSNGNGDGSAIHLSLQGKGGVGKSLAASILAQYFIARGKPVRCIDSDPVNKTLSQYAALRAEPLMILRDGIVDQRAFDQLMETMLTEDGTFIVDNGASTFIPLWHYLLENNAIEMFRHAGRQIYVHTIITGGQALGDTLKGFAQIAETTADQNIVVWVNEYFGRVEYDGKPATELKAFRDHAEKVHGCVAIRKRNQDTFGRDVEEVICRKITFEEAIRDGAFSIMTKQRLQVVQRELFEQLDDVFALVNHQ